MIDLNILNSDEKVAIEELRKRVENIFPMDLENDPAIFYRFLKARDFNLDKGEKMLRKHLIWRKANQISTILKDYKVLEVFSKHIEMSILGTDKVGDVVCFLSLGKLDSRDCLKCMTRNTELKLFQWQCEKIKSHLLQNSDKEKNMICQAFIIVDLENLTFSNATTKTCGWEEPLLKAVDENVLPAFLGGKRTDPDGNPLCKTFVRHCGKMPSCYYLSDEERYFKDKTRVKHLFVPPSSAKEIYVDVQKERSIIIWEFLIKGKDIGFGLFFKESEGMTELLPIQRMDTIDGVEKGSYRAKVTGKYIIIFDNSYSWLSSKEIEYCVTVKQEV